VSTVEFPSGLSLVIVASIVLVAGGAWLIWRRMSGSTTPLDQAEPSITSDLLGASVASTPEPRLSVKRVESLEINPSVKSSSAAEQLASLAKKIPDQDLREFLCEIVARVQETGPCFDEETPLRFIEEIVDRLDDLRAIAKNHRDETVKDLDSFRQVLVSVLAKCGAELINSELWDPALQRAIAKEPTPGLTTPSILRFGSTGICRNGQLVRKQEVVLATPQ